MAAHSATALRPRPPRDGGTSRPGQTLQTAQKESLLDQLMHELLLLARLGSGWDGERAKPFDEKILHRAADLGRMVALGMTLNHPDLNMSPLADGRIMFSLFGENGREVELYVEDDSGQFSYVADDGATSKEGRMPIAAFLKIEAWLAGKLQDL